MRNDSTGRCFLHPEFCPIALMLTSMNRERMLSLIYHQLLTELVA